MNAKYLDLHVIQTVPPSCINRDDTGSPKMAIYGGVPRARVSSQAWKHAMRGMFSELFFKRTGWCAYKTRFGNDNRRTEKVGISGEYGKSCHGRIEKMRF